MVIRVMLSMGGTDFTVAFDTGSVDFEKLKVRAIADAAIEEYLKLAEAEKASGKKKRDYPDIPNLATAYEGHSAKYVYMSKISKKAPKEEEIDKLEPDELDDGLCLLDGGKRLAYYCGDKAPLLPGLGGKRLTLHGDEDSDHGVYIYAPQSATAQDVTQDTFAATPLPVFGRRENDSFQGSGPKPSASSMKPSSSIVGASDAVGTFVSVPYGFLGEAAVFMPPQALSQLALKDGAPSDLAAELRDVLRMRVPYSTVFSDVPEDTEDAVTTQRLLVLTVQAMSLNHRDILEELEVRPTPGTILFTENHQTSLASPLCTMKPDWARTVVQFDNTIVAAAEAKRGSASMLEAMTQAFLAAATGAMQLYQAGVPPEECIVPFFTFNGFTEQHGVAYVLSNGLPCCAIISRIFELSLFDDALEAARFRVAINNRSKHLYSLLRKAFAKSGKKEGVKAAARPSSSLLFEFAYDDYFVKPLDILQHVSKATAVVFQLGIFERLRRGGVPAVLPVTRISHSSKGLRTHSELVFPRMTAYSSGLPEDALFPAWLSALAAAVRKMHAAGVVHLDIHPHNVLYRVCNGSEVEVLLVDFDAALLLSQETPKEVIEHVQRGSWADAYPSFLEEGKPPSPLIDWYFVAAILLSYYMGESAHWRLPATRQRPALDQLFDTLVKHRELLESVSGIMKDGDISAVLKAFEGCCLGTEDMIVNIRGLKI